MKAAIVSTFITLLAVAEPVNVFLDTTLNETSLTPMVTANDSTELHISPETPCLVVVVLIQGLSSSMVNETIWQEALNLDFQSYISALGYAEFGFELVDVPTQPTPSEILDILCKKLLTRNVLAILYVNDSGHRYDTIVHKYIFELIMYLNIPIIWLSYDDFGLIKRPSDSLVLNLVPTIKHQSEAILTFLERFNLTHFSVFAIEKGGYSDFIKTIQSQLDTPRFRKLQLLSTAFVDYNSGESILRRLFELREAGAPIVLLHSPDDMTWTVFVAAVILHMTVKNYVWILTQSVVGARHDHNWISFPPGTIGVNFDTGNDAIKINIINAIRILRDGLQLYLNDSSTEKLILFNRLSSLTEEGSRWQHGRKFYEFLKNVSVRNAEQDSTFEKVAFHFTPRDDGRDYQPLQFNSDGTLRYPELQVVNYKRDRWREVGRWVNGYLDMNTIVWPGNSDEPPTQIKRLLKVVFLEEPPFVFLTKPDNNTGECPSEGVLCQVAKDRDFLGIDQAIAKKNTSYFQCCSGFSVDLMNLFAKDLRFTYKMVRVEDRSWGSNVDGTWNGLVAALLNGKHDVAMTGFNINSERQQVIDFTMPFMESAVTIVVAKRSRAVSLFALLEPFDVVSWLIILLICVQLAAFAIFFFEWCSPTGYDHNIRPSRGHISLSQTFWLVWAILVGASVNVWSPRGTTARFMANFWALFAVVLMAIYTANLTTFMMTKEQYLDLKGIDDERLVNPLSIEPPLRFATVTHSNTEQLLFKNYPDMYRYMGQFNVSSVLEGVTSVRNGSLDAFLYDSTVLSYHVSQEDSCSLLTVGSLHALGGYGVAFPKNSRLLESFDHQLLTYKQNGELERLQKYWMTAACKPSEKSRETTVAESLSVLQFTSAFLLLLLGIVSSLLLLGLEHIYIKYRKKRLVKIKTGGGATSANLFRLETL